ncbi:MAG: riboflavin biosynthesis protein RibD [Chloroflexi bacterium]|nr:riboflavin biosynthesis protein RibD [Chloroflexota bacterium]
MLDPSPWVAGEGIRALESAGISTLVGERADEAARLNEAYFKWVRTSFPFVTLKYAMTADGKGATGSGSSSWVTGVEARKRVAHLRSTVDAVMVGIGTVLADNPVLTSRPGDFGDPDLDPVHQPLRVILDSTARLPVDSRVASEQEIAHTLVITTARAPEARVERLRDLGLEIVAVDESEGHVDVSAALWLLGKRGILSVQAECGGTLAASLFQAGVVDKVLAFVAPKIVGGALAPSPVEGPGILIMGDAIVLRDVEWSILGEDALLTGYVMPANVSGVAGAVDAAAPSLSLPV